MPRPSPTRWAPLVTAFVTVVVVCLVAAAAFVGYERASKAGPYVQSGRWTSHVTSILPTYENCGSTPEFEPGYVTSCGTPCDSVVLNIRWTTWTTTRAQGTGTFETNLHQRDCSGRDGPPRPGIPRPGTTIVLRQPETRLFCARNGRDEFVEHDQTIFTITNLLPPLEIPRCSGAGDVTHPTGAHG